MSVAEWPDRYGIQQWTILRSSYRKLAWMGFVYLLYIIYIYIYIYIYNI